MAMGPQDVRDVIDAVEGAGLSIWLDGGWVSTHFLGLSTVSSRISTSSSRYRSPLACGMCWPASTWRLQRTTCRPSRARKTYATTIAGVMGAAHVWWAPPPVLRTQRAHTGWD